MDIEKILANEYATEKLIGEAFYDVASEEANSTLIKKLFLKLDYRNKLTSSVLTYGLIATLELNQPKNFSTIMQYMEKFNVAIDSDIITNALTNPLDSNPEQSFSAIKEFMLEHKVQPDRSRLTSYLFNSIENNTPVFEPIDLWAKSDIDMSKDLAYLQAIFNCASSYNNTDLANTINQKFSVIDNSLKEQMDDYIVLVDGTHSCMGELMPDGSLSMSGSMGGPISNQAERMNHFKMNPFLFDLSHFNSEKLDVLLENNNSIDSSVITHGLVRSIYHNNQEAVKYLFTNPQCIEVIKRSPEIQKFITCNVDIDWEHNKAQARSFLEKLLSDNNLSVKSTYKP